MEVLEINTEVGWGGWRELESKEKKDWMLERERSSKDRNDWKIRRKKDVRSCKNKREERGKKRENIARWEKE